MPATTTHFVSAALLLPGELEDVQRSPADVQPRDHMHDRHALEAGARAGAAAATPRVSQNIAVSGAPPKSAAPAMAPASPASQAAGT